MLSNKRYSIAEAPESFESEPSFDGELWFVYVDETKKVFPSVTVTSSAVGSYAGTRQVIDTRWDEWFRGLVPKAETVPFGFVTLGRPHQYFPFDSATFDFTLTAEPQFNQRLVQVINRVPGFVLPCDKLKASPDEKGGLHVSFVNGEMRECLAKAVEKQIHSLA